MAPDKDESFAKNLYYERAFDTNAAKVLPGEYYATNQDMVIVTVLGSCFAACICDRESGIGGLNHFMLPESHLSDDGAMSRPARYGTYAMEILINLAARLDGLCAIRVSEAVHGEPVPPGHAYIAPGDQHMSVGRPASRYVIGLSDGPPVNRHRPSVEA